MATELSLQIGLIHFHWKFLTVNQKEAQVEILFLFNTMPQMLSIELNLYLFLFVMYS